MATFRTPLVVSLVCALLSVLLKLNDQYEWVEAFMFSREVSFNESAYSSFSVGLAFMMVFRTSQSYNRFWEGTTCIHQITGAWFDAASSFLAFSRISTASEHQTTEFQHTLVRLISLCNALVFAELEGKSSDWNSKAFSYNVIDINGIDRNTLRLIAEADCKLEVVFQLIQVLCTHHITTGVLNVPPPILTRAFQDLSSACLRFHETHKLTTVPFPFPYAAMTEVLRRLHFLVTPVVVCIWTKQWWWAAFFSFVVVLPLWSLGCIAEEMDNPFVESANDLDGDEMQCYLNERLLAIFPCTEKPPPTLSRRAIKNVQILTAQAKRTNSYSSSTPRVTGRSFTSGTSLKRIFLESDESDDDGSPRRSTQLRSSELQPNNSDDDNGQRLSISSPLKRMSAAKLAAPDKPVVQAWDGKAADGSPDPSSNEEEERGRAATDSSFILSQVRPSAFLLPTGTDSEAALPPGSIHRDVAQPPGSMPRGVTPSDVEDLARNTFCGENTEDSALQGSASPLRTNAHAEPGLTETGAAVVVCEMRSDSKDYHHMATMT